MKFLALPILLALVACDNNENSNNVTAEKQAAVSETVDTPKAEPTVKADTGLTRDRVLGNPDAPVTVIEYASFTCGHCGNFHRNVYPTLKKDYIDSGKVKFIYRNFPLDPLSLKASQLSYCMPENLFYEFSGLLYDRQAYWVQEKEGEERLKSLAATSGLSAEEISKCLNNEDLRNAIAQQRQTATTKYNVRFTPTLIVDGENKGSIGSVEELEKALGVVEIRGKR